MLEINNKMGINSISKGRKEINCRSCFMLFITSRMYVTAKTVRHQKCIFPDTTN